MGWDLATFSGSSLHFNLLVQSLHPGSLSGEAGVVLVSLPVSFPIAALRAVIVVIFLIYVTSLRIFLDNCSSSVFVVIVRFDLLNRNESRYEQ
jgi:hypothetical protein